VQVWLRTGVREGAVQWTGTVTLAPAGKPPEALPFDPIHPKVSNGTILADEVRVKAADGWAVRPERSRGWQTVSAPAGEVRFHTDQPAAPPLRVLLSAVR
jgi:hypothetical protein